MTDAIIKTILILLLLAVSSSIRLRQENLPQVGIGCVCKYGNGSSYVGTVTEGGKCKFQWDRQCTCNDRVGFCHGWNKSRDALLEYF